MNASKEEARKATKELWAAAKMLDLLIPGAGDRTEVKRHLLRVENFVEAAERKLPSEAAFARDRKRTSSK